MPKQTVTELDARQAGFMARPVRESIEAVAERKKNRPKWMSGLFVKIQTIAVIAIIGIAVLIAINKAVNDRADITARQSQLGTDMSNQVLNALLVEEKFIQSGEAALVPDIDNYLHSFEATVKTLRNNAVSPEIDGKLNAIAGVFDSHHQGFDSMVPGVVALKQGTDELNNRFAAANNSLAEILDTIGREEATLSLSVEDLPPAKADLRDHVSQMMAHLKSYLANVQDLLLSNNADEFTASRSEIEKTISEKRVVIAAQLGLVDEPVYSESWQKVEAELNELAPLQTSLFDRWQQQQDWRRKSVSIGRQLQQNSQDLANDIFAFSTLQRAQANRFALGAAGCVILGLLTFGTFISRGIVRSVGRTVHMLKDIAEGEGDLTRRLEAKSRDELGEMARWFNTFMDRLQNMVKEVSRNSSGLHTASAGLFSIARQLSTGAGGMSQKSEAVSCATAEMSAKMMSVAAASEQTSTNTNMVASAIVQMTATAQEIAHHAGQAREVSQSALQQADNATEKINRLRDAAEQIHQVTETITEISEQINLLALNATIEAARAGEAGRGFSVVAEEIKELARQTAKATQEIKERLNGITDSTFETAGEINEITQVINQVNRIINDMASVIDEQSTASQQIAGNISQASLGIQDVNINVNQASAFSSSISSDISEVHQTIQDIGSVSDLVHQQSDKLEKLSAGLMEVVGRFKV